MHCPNCGNESDLDQKFCRRCGFNLEPVGKLMLVDEAAEEVTSEKVQSDKVLLQRMVSWMMRGLVVLLLGVVVIVVNKQLLLNQLFGLVGTLMALAGFSLMAYGVLDAMRCGAMNKSKPKNIAPPLESEIERASTTKSLEGRLPVPLGSVTERTTELLGVDREQHS